MIFYFLISIVVLNIIYVVGFFFASILTKATEAHYFLGFNPKLFTFQVRGVKFTLGLYIPIVGLARIYAIVNGEKQRAKYPWEFSDRSIAKRIVATMAGAIALLITGILISIGINYSKKDSIITKENVIRYGIYPSDAAKKLGFQYGDKIIALNGKDYEQFDDLINPNVILNPNSYYTILRDGKELNIYLTSLTNYFPENNELFISLIVPFEVAEIMPDSPADEVGIIQGDRITKVNRHSIIKFTEMTDAFVNDDDGNVDLEIQRRTSDSVKTMNINVTLNDERKLGILRREIIEYTIKENTLGEAVQKGVPQAFRDLYKNVRVVFRIQSGNLNPKKSLSGPVGIAAAYGNNTVFWKMIGFYAMWYAFWNLLPLPKSAFWELTALGYEGITKKKYSYSLFKKSISLIWIPFVALVLWVLISDLLKLF